MKTKLNKSPTRCDGIQHQPQITRSLNSVIINQEEGEGLKYFPLSKIAGLQSRNKRSFESIYHVEQLISESYILMQRCGYHFNVVLGTVEASLNYFIHC